jgi:hypothetical protein
MMAAARGQEGNRRLVAWVVPRPGGAVGDLAGFLRGKLPAHMIPEVWVPIDAVPLTPHGKVDHAALARLGETREPAAAFVAPANFLRTGYVIAFRVDNSKGATQKIGDHVINIPANAICDLATSGYGETTWNKSCAPLKGSVVITATVLSGPDGEPMIDFQPAMRFVPNKEVTLFFKDSKAGAKNLSIKYCNNVGYCVDESLTDSSLQPFRVGRGIVGRRVKHFSGYVVAYECAEGEICPPPGGAMRKSGYMVASGEDITDVMTDTKVDHKKDE